MMLCAGRALDTQCASMLEILQVHACYRDARTVKEEIEGDLVRVDQGMDAHMGEKTSGGEVFMDAELLTSQGDVPPDGVRFFSQILHFSLLILRHPASRVVLVFSRQSSRCSDRSSASGKVDRAGNS